MDVVSLPPGTIIGNYKILKAQGQGGFGITYIAWDRVLERNVAMKECFPATICRRTEAGGLAPLRPELEDMYAAAMADMRREARAHRYSALVRPCGSRVRNLSR